MKKRIAALFISMLATGALTISVFAAPAYTATTTITNNNRTAVGSTYCASATFCSVTMTAYSAAGVQQGFNSGSITASVVKTVGSPYSFTSANSSHEIQYYEKGTPNSIYVTSGAGESR